MSVQSVCKNKHLLKQTFLIIVVFFLINNFVFAAPWRIGANITAAEEYTDGVHGGEEQQGEFITEISPGVTVRRQGARIGVLGNYSYHHRMYSRSDRDNSNHSLRAVADAELIKNKLFTNAFSNYRRQITDPLGFLSISPSSGTENQNDVWTNGVGATLTNRYWRFARSRIVYSYSTTEQIDTALPSTEEQKVSASFTNGPDFSRVFWGLNYNYSKSGARQQNNIERQSLLLNIGYRFTKKLSAFFTAGYEINPQLAETEDEHLEGVVKTLTINWVPTRKWSFSAMYGERSFGETYDYSINWIPTVRSNFRATYGKGPFGETYSASASHRKRKSIWNLNYTESLTSRAILEAQLQLSLARDDEGNPIINEQTGEQLFSIHQINVLVDDTFIDKNLSAGVTFTGRYTTLVFGLKYGQRIFERLGFTDELYSGSANITRTLGKRANLAFGTTFSENHFEQVDRIDNVGSLQTSYNHRLGKRTDFSLEYRYIKRWSTDSNAKQYDYLIRAQVAMAFGH